MNQVSLGQPLKDTTSPALVFGMPLKQASDVRATETPQLPSKKPICLQRKKNHNDTYNRVNKLTRTLK